MSPEEIEVYRGLKERYPNLDQDEMRQYRALTMKVEGERANPIFKGIPIKKFLEIQGKA